MPATVVHVAVAPVAALPWPDIPADRVVDLTAPGLQAAAFTPPAAASGDWYVALGGRDACRAGAGDEDGIQGQADRLARVVGAFAGLGGGLAIVADAGAGHAARRAAEAVAAVTTLVSAGTPVDPISLQILDAAPGADALRLLVRLLPALPQDETDELGDDPDLHLGRGLVDALAALIELDDPARELRPPSLPPAPPRVGLAVHMLFGEVGADAARRAITAIVAAGLADRAALQAEALVAEPFAPPDRIVIALAAALAPAAPPGTLRVDGRAHIVLGELRVVGDGVSLVSERTLDVHLGVGRAGGWLIGGPDPGRAPGQPVPHHLRRVSFDLALPIGAGAGSASITLHEARVFDLVRERWRLQASDLPTTQAGFDAATTLLPEARVLLSGVAQALAGEASGAGAALALVLRALGAIDAAGGSVPDAIEHLLNDAGARLRALVAEATSRGALVAALRALWPQGADAAAGEVLVAAGPLSARVAFAPLAGRAHRRRRRRYRERVGRRRVRLVRVARQARVRRERRRRRVASHRRGGGIAGDHRRRRARPRPLASPRARVAAARRRGSGRGRALAAAAGRGVRARVRAPRPGRADAPGARRLARPRRQRASGDRRRARRRRPARRRRCRRTCVAFRCRRRSSPTPSPG